MGAGGDFRVTVRKKEVVAAVLPFQEHWLPLSNIDLTLLPIDVCVFFCYKKPKAEENFTFGSMVSVLKKSLAQALVSYYSFAGEVVPNSVGEPELLCNNTGVEFIEASADIELCDINLHNPDESIEGKLVPKKNKGVLCVQVTELKCGGLIVACTFDHRIADAYSTNMFLVSWAEMAQSKPLSVLPFFRRSILNPRRPGFYDPSLDDMYLVVSALPPPQQPEPRTDHLISRIYYVTGDQLAHLQSVASSGTSKRTKLESFSAFLWKMVAKNAAASKNMDKKICKMGIVVDGRTRLSDGDCDKAAKMSAYFGNVVSIPHGGQKVEELNDKSLSVVADDVHDFIESAVTKEHFLDLIDWVEAHRPEQTVAKMFFGAGADGPGFVVSSGQRFPAAKVDFGWGRPVLGSYHFPWGGDGGGDAGFVMPMPSPVGNGDWVVYMLLLKGQLELIESEAGNMFKPLTSDYLNLNLPN